MAQPSFDDLLTVPTQQDTLDQEVYPELTKRKVRVTDWIVNGAYRGMAWVVALMRVKAREALVAIMAAGFEDYAFGFSTPPPLPDGSIIDVTGWAPLIAKNRYGVDQILASNTRRTITLTNATAGPYGPLAQGSIILQFPSGNRYVMDDDAVTIPASDSIEVTFRSEFASDSKNGIVYNDPPGSTINFVTASYPGVVATNPPTDYSEVAQSGGGVGLVTPSGTPSGDHSIVVLITATGKAADESVGWSTSLDGDSFQVQSGDSVSNLEGTGVDITLTDNSGDPAFVIGARYYFQTPGSDITQVGADVETPQSLGLRCRGLWPSLAFAKDPNGNWIPASPTMSAYVALALSANDQVRLAFVQTGTINNVIDIIIAGQGGATLPPGVLASEQTFFNSFSMLTDRPVVSAPTPRTITLAAGAITVAAAQLLTAQAALQLALQKYFGGVDSALPLSVNGRIDHAYVADLIRTTTGVTAFDDVALTINGAAADLQLPVTPGAFENASWTQEVATAFIWRTS